MSSETIEKLQLTVFCGVLWGVMYYATDWLVGFGAAGEMIGAFTFGISYVAGGFCLVGIIALIFSSVSSTK